MRLTIAQKLVFALALLMTCSFIGLTALQLTKQYHMAIREGQLIADHESLAYMGALKSKITLLETVLDAYGSSNALLGSGSRPESKQQLSDSLAGLLASSASIHNVFTMWQPGLMDQQPEPYYIYLQKDGDGGDAGQEEERRSNASEGFSLLQQQPSGEPVVLGPYEVKQGGVDTPSLSVLMPVRKGRDGQAAGVIGTELQLHYPQGKSAPGSYAAITSGSAVYALNGTNEQLKPVRDSGRYFHYFYPLEIGSNRWQFELHVSKSSTLNDFYASLRTTVVLAIAALAALTALMVLLIKKVVVQNIMKVVHVSSALAKGGGHHKLDIRTKDEFEVLAVHFNRMVDYRKEAEDLVRHQATHDLLTSLPNRYGYNRYVESQAASPGAARPAALLYIDLDRFKYVNDKMDYTMGDLLLKRVARRIVQTMNDKGKVFRFGSDEFVVLIENIGHLHQINRMAEDLLLEIARPIKLQDRMFYVTASIGMSMQPALTAEMGERLLKEADVAMYMAKKHRNTSRLYSPSMNEMPYKETALEAGLLPALENGQFLLYYQPKVNIQSGKIYGAEALIRWKHPEFGIVSPLDFIPLAEKTGFIIPLGEWVLRAACKQLKQWDGQGLHDLTVSVNLSMIQFQQKHLVHTIEQIISEEGVDPRRIELELTESIFMDNPGDTLRILHALRLLGVRLSLDDFGTGYSSLSYLQSIPIQYLKLDKTFIHDIVNDYRKQMIFKSLIVIAHNLNMEVVTEGVETAEELAIIKSHQCDSVQGYLYSPPVPPDRFEELYKQQIA
ncbi:GGDEF domain-containing protein [Paenibacillus protaetiae]|uniref:GGDEF domain-containing protein n=2 Tax=Paenibacillus protaetiae TaxID=2509456 RepID=A0A4P6EYJ5_9BACL|nr:GGDEF domain-containing protein [Paenibacillus protaetiae]